MTEQPDGIVYQSALPYDADRIHAAAIYCSDGRFGQQCDDFLHNSLRLPRYDRLAVPGGPACLAGHFVAYREADAVAEQLDFLIRVHELDRVVLIAHDACAFYRERLKFSAHRVNDLQRIDLSKAAARIRSFSQSLRVDGYFALTRGGRICFQEVPIAVEGQWV